MLWAFALGNIFPDIDLFYFYFWDHRRHMHHHYWTHLPMFWLAILLAVAGLSWIPKIRRVAPVAYYFLAGVLVHMVLDTPFGGIDWVYPLAGDKVHLFYVVTIPNQYGWWLWNFIFHWTFLTEIIVWIAAGFVFWRADREKQHNCASTP